MYLLAFKKVEIFKELNKINLYSKLKNILKIYIKNIINRKIIKLYMNLFLKKYYNFKNLLTFYSLE